MGSAPKSDELIDELLDIYSKPVIPFLKIRRDMPFPTESDRQETDGEHSYTLAMLAITLAERMALGLDAGLLAKYALVHDLVEVHAGDTSARAGESDQVAKARREHEALLLIKERHLAHAPWISEYIERYERREDDESKFIYAADKLMGALTRIAGNGDHWAAYYRNPDSSDYRRVVGTLRKKAEAYPPLLELFDTLHDRLGALQTVYYEKSKHEPFRQPS